MTAGYGPMQARQAKQAAEGAWWWSLELRQAVEAEDLVEVGRLTALMRGELQRLEELTARASGRPAPARDHRWAANEDATVTPFGGADRCLDCRVPRYTVGPRAVELNAKAEGPCPGGQE